MQRYLFSGKPNKEGQKDKDKDKEKLAQPETYLPWKERALKESERCKKLAKQVNNVNSPQELEHLIRDIGPSLEQEDALKRLDLKRFRKLFNDDNNAKNANNFLNFLHALPENDHIYFLNCLKSDWLMSLYNAGGNEITFKKWTDATNKFRSSEDPEIRFLQPKPQREKKPSFFIPFHDRCAQADKLLGSNSVTPTNKR